MRPVLALLTGVTAGITLTVYTRRYAAAFAWWAFSRGDHP